MVKLNDLTETELIITEKRIKYLNEKLQEMHGDYAHFTFAKGKIYRELRQLAKKERKLKYLIKTYGPKPALAPREALPFGNTGIEHEQEVYVQYECAYPDRCYLPHCDCPTKGGSND